MGPSAKLKFVKSVKSVKLPHVVIPLAVEIQASIDAVQPFDPREKFRVGMQATYEVTVRCYIPAIDKINVLEFVQEGQIPGRIMRITESVPTVSDRLWLKRQPKRWQLTVEGERVDVKP